jgi:NAD/NADP transhydrogenase alpha subunit
MHNPSLREEPRHKPAPTVSTQQQVSILDWLNSTGRLIARESDSYEYEDNIEELQELMVGDDGGYDDDDDDDEVGLDDDE